MQSSRKSRRLVFVSRKEKDRRYRAGGRQKQYFPKVFGIKAEGPLLPEHDGEQDESEQEKAGDQHRLLYGAEPVADRDREGHDPESESGNKDHYKPAFFLFRKYPSFRSRRR